MRPPGRYNRSSPEPACASTDRSDLLRRPISLLAAVVPTFRVSFHGGWMPGDPGPDCSDLGMYEPSFSRISFFFNDTAPTEKRREVPSWFPERWILRSGNP